MNYKLKEMPRVALGTWEITDPQAVEATVVAALQNGYKHIDTAQLYFNEELIGMAWPKSGVAREDFWFTTKIMPINFRYNAYKSIVESVKRLNTEYIDTILLHSTLGTEENIIAYKEAMRAREAGLVRTIGVSNMTIEEIEEIKEATGEYPKYLQIVASVLQRIEKLEEYASEKGITLMGYSSIRPYYNPNPFYATESLTDEDREVIDSIAKKHNTSPAMVLQKFIYDKGYVILPKSQKAERVISNIKVLEVELDKEDVEKLEKMNKADYSYYLNTMDMFRTSFAISEDMKKQGVRVGSLETDQAFIAMFAKSKEDNNK